MRAEYHEPPNTGDGANGLSRSPRLHDTLSQYAEAARLAESRIRRLRRAGVAWSSRLIAEQQRRYTAALRSATELISTAGEIGWSVAS